MKPLWTLIYNNECVACSAIAQLIGARAPDIAKVSFYSPKAQMLLRRHFPGGWAAAPDDQMRGWIPASPADAAAFAGEALMLPDPATAGLRCGRLIQWYNQHGAFQTASYWKHGESGSLVLEQVHRACALPVVEGATPELVDLGCGRNAHCYVSPVAGSEAITLIAGSANGRWLSLRATGIDRDVVLAIARTCYQAVPLLV